MRTREITSEAPALTNSDDERWRVVLARDAACDGRFVFAVRTTGIYCRPSCPARRPKRANVAFHASAEAAERDGFRPCRRCRPRDASPAIREAEVVARACRALETADRTPTLAALAGEACLSPSHFQRLFKKTTGLTPKQYAAGARARRFERELRRGQRVTDAIYEAGFSSSGRAYAASTARLGMKPSALRMGGRGLAIRSRVVRCSLGRVLVAATENGVCAILLGDDAKALFADLQARFPEATFEKADARFDRWVARVVALVDDPARGLQLPLDIRGSAFELRVWEALRKIPSGTTASYGEIAQAIARPKAARAVASACARNPLAIAIPCHRVVRSDGATGGYRWGRERKRHILEREADGRPVRPRRKPR